MVDKGETLGDSASPEAAAEAPRVSEYSQNKTPKNPNLWKPGQSGNPAGKPKGALHRTTQAVMEMMNGEAEAITRKAIDMAKAGDMTALKLVLDRIAPAVKCRTIKIDLPPINSLDDVLKGHSVIAESLAEGEITPDEAATVASVLEVKRRTIETVELEQRLAKIEQQIEAKK